MWTYDNAGNIHSRTEYAYTTGTVGTAIDTVDYDYDDDWGDLLTSYDGQSNTYDGIGNPTSYYNGTRWTFGWEHGRELVSASNGTTTWNYTYNSDGLRTSRTNGSTTYKYLYNGSSLVQMTVGGNTLYFTDDTVTFNNTVYYYVKNLQGDVIAILNGSGSTVVQYTYDAWGSILSMSDTSGVNLGTINPLRYRSYVYDTESGLYYLQSRYYDPEVGRFINADIVVDTGALLGHNLFAYCENTPVICKDDSGYGKIYVIYYDSDNTGFEEQAENSPYYASNSDDVVMIGVTTNEEFINAWNSIDGDVDCVYLYLHGGEGVLYFRGEHLCFSEVENETSSLSFADLQPKNINETVYLFSCDGGKGAEGNNVAFMLADLTDTQVYACTGHVSYSELGGNYYARKSMRDLGTWHLFFYYESYVFSDVRYAVKY